VVWCHARCSRLAEEDMELIIYAAVLLCCIPSLAHPPICLSVLYGLQTLKTKRHRRNEIGVNVYHGRSNRCVSFHFKRSKNWGFSGWPHNMLAPGQHVFLAKDIEWSCGNLLTSVKSLLTVSLYHVSVVTCLIDV